MQALAGGCLKVSKELLCRSPLDAWGSIYFPPATLSGGRLLTKVKARGPCNG
jgi:hypothetical protein